MDPALALRLAVQDGVVTTADALACGVQRRDLTRLVRSGALVRVRERAYVEGSRWHAATPAQRHALSALAVGRSFGSGWAISHCSALAVHGIPVLRLDPAVHLSRVGPGARRSRAGITAHVQVDPTQVGQVSGVATVNPAVAVVQTAASQGVEAGVVAADAAIRNRLVTASTLQQALVVARLGPRGGWARLAVRLSDGRSESPGESRTRVLFHLAGLTDAEPQVEIWHGGRMVARVDLLFRAEKVVVEFDGVVKYADANGRAALVAEKRREDELRALGYEVGRLTWRDLADPARVIAMVQAALQRAAAWRVPVAR